MDLKTTTQENFKGVKGERTKPCKAEPKFDEKPSQKVSSYSAMYPNWNNGKKDIFHEAAP
jgi:hypothetical protein